MNQESGECWKVQHRFVEMRSDWLTVIGEHLQDNCGQTLEYWRVEKADSVVILPIQSHQIILPPPSYRPGLSKLTLDFPGGRLPSGKSPDVAVPAILQRELGVEATAISQLIALNSEGWPVNSSFSNQKLYGFVAHLEPTPPIKANYLGATYPATSAGVHDLLQSLICLQCRAVLMQWWLELGTSK
ncbi:putative hydrolase, NUDIX family [Tolypothrix tenuis PCC 7101]|uniref:Putative hydrolase, NUDIX family n=1 Tax=Tolypothrix tenuis PCC 7101 TaxID=231146 RepID=A0A1Z4MSE6_9CYAN|nr:NUDIX hydrolase [Aulosira sp. FACHB-113]BAY96388.1 putative hydrolase, NUDIX family [Tolypothrix tenuis PCC 7101]BAZ73104.1 putative hydrolase, NUDIX family [Aulosira laxa NIES-50]